MHAQILLPLKQENSANSPSWFHSRCVHHAGEHCSDMAGVDGRQLVSYRSHMTTPISVTERICFVLVIAYA